MIRTAFGIKNCVNCILNQDDKKREKERKKEEERRRIEEEELAKKEKEAGEKIILLNFTQSNFTFKSQLYLLH